MENLDAKYWINFCISAQESLLSGNSSLCIKKVGQEFCDINKRIEKRNRNYYSLHFIMFGSGILKVNNKGHLLNAGDAFLLYEGEQYEYYPSRTDPWSYIWIDFYGENVESLYEQMGVVKEKPYVKIIQFKEMINLLKELHEAYSEGVFSDLTICGYFMMVLDRLLKNHETISLKHDKKLLRFKQVREMLIYMNNNFRTELNPSELANRFHLSLRTFIRIFTEETGMPPMEYINAFRISTACELISRRRELTMVEVAESVGFVDQRYFSRVFKKIKGVTPTEYAIGNNSEDPFKWLKEKNIDLR